ncbi:hypothetical protein [Halorussus litoreus]|uniref:hypothetical protein n=1 Tax=Halorussus litoreus TaxID=1710536 RepID=UPI0018E575C4|nr:hypothetical protein [Halorussus litoreus]
MTDNVPSRRAVLVGLATTTGGCLGQVFDNPSMALTGIRLHNWTNYQTTIHLQLFREDERVLEERVSLAPLQEPGSVASFTPGWSVEDARYRIRLEETDGGATLERRLPPDDFSWDGCAYADIDLENGWGPNRTVGPDAEKSFEMHLQEVTDPKDFSSDYCPDR